MQGIAMSKASRKNVVGETLVSTQAYNNRFITLFIQK
jgi:hypothetical protein